jgi:myo-inositol-1(or 4)-monophosphatase
VTDPAVALPILAAAARAAGDTAMAWFRQGARTSAEISYKAGDSPVSAADIAANDRLEQDLRDRFPDHGWISEETATEPAWLSRRHLLIVDPIDGTRAFIEGDPRWSVSVGLVTDGRAVAGVVHAPALGRTIMAAAGHGATLNGQSITCPPRQAIDGASVDTPKFLFERLEKGGATLHRAGRTPSLALRLAGVAEGRCDLGIASEGAHVWDIAAADIILAEAGAVLIDAQGDTMRYDRPELRRGLLAAGSPSVARAAINLIGLRG